MIVPDIISLNASVTIEERLAACEQEMQQMSQYDYVVVNDQVEKALEKVEAIIIAERCRIHNLKLR